MEFHSILTKNLAILREYSKLERSGERRRG
jgi:hypothetical protein